MKNLKNKKIAVAMSGGVDSSVCALLLKKAGADVFGITLRTLDDSKCCSLNDIRQAKQIAAQLKIPHFTVESRKEFRKEAIDYFVNESLKGKNPNPCVPCNRKIKFGKLMKFAFKQGAELVATGHYARLEKKNKNIILKRPKEVSKDQSYVLSMLPKKTFEKLIFPMGNYTKERVRKIAKENNLPVFSKPESQDLCFLKKDKGTFIKKHSLEKVKPGKILDVKGNLLGMHRGISNYSLGQRKGIGIKTHKKLYVCKINARKNEITVGERDCLALKKFTVTKLNWVSIPPPKKIFTAEVLIRNKSRPHKARIIPKGKSVEVISEDSFWGVSPGQIAVFIKNNIVLGGGWIK